MLLFRVFQASEGKREASEEHQTRAAGEGAEKKIASYSAPPLSRVSQICRSSSLASRLPSLAWKARKNRACSAGKPQKDK